MKHRILNVLFLLTTAFVLSSCLGSSDDNTYTYYEDAAITAFNLGTMNLYVDNGDGTTTKKTYTGSTYKFYIDQENGLIYNPDSLPYGTDAEHVVMTITAMNSGVVFWKTIDEDDYTYYISSDSVDVSVDRQLRVLSQSGNHYRDYTLKVNVHKEDGDLFAWKTPQDTDEEGNVIGNADLSALQGMKALALNGEMFVFGTDGTKTVIYSTNQNDGKTWTERTPSIVLSAEAYKGVITNKNQFYVIDGENLLSSPDAISWQVVKEAIGLKQLIAATPAYIYGISADGKIMVSSNDGKDWSADEVEEGNDDKLPAMTEGFVYTTLKTNSDMGQVTVFGKDASDKTVIWLKTTDDEDASAYPWSLIEAGSQTPQLTSISVFGYGDNIMMLGLKDGTATNFLVSKDSGLNWAADTTYKLPVELATEVFTATVDEKNFIWLINGEGGQVWRGRLNRLGWEKQ